MRLLDALFRRLPVVPRSYAVKLIGDLAAAEEKVERLERSNDNLVRSVNAEAKARGTAEDEVERLHDKLEDAGRIAIERGAEIERLRKDLAWKDAEAVQLRRKIVAARTALLDTDKA